MEEDLKLPKESLTEQKLEEIREEVRLLVESEGETDRDPDAEKKLTRLMHDACCFLEKDDDIVLLVKVIELLANSARNENRRMAITAFEGMEFVVGYMRKYGDNEELVIQALRLIANLCFDAEEGRNRLIKMNAVKDISEILFNASSAALLRVSAGCISNMCSVTEDICTELFGYGVLDKLCQLVEGDNPDVAYMAIRAVSNMCETEEIRRWVFDNVTLEKLLSLAESDVLEDPDMSIEYVNCIGSVIETTELCESFINELNGIERWIQLFVSSDDESFIKKMVEVICNLAENDTYRVNFLPFTNQIFEIIEIGDILIKRYAAAKITAYISVNEEIATVLFEHIDRFIELLQSQDPEFPIYSGMTISNLAMDDEKCQKVFAKGVPLILLDLASNSESDIKLRHYCISALRNLSVSEANKEPILEMGVMKPAAELLDQKMNAILVYNCLGLIKSLFVLGDASFDQFIEAGGMENLVPLLEMDDTPHVLFESARAFCALAKAPRYHALLMSNNAEKAIITLIKSDFNILKIEGISAMAALAKNLEYAKKLSTEDLIAPVINALQESELVSDSLMALILLSKTEAGNAILSLSESLHENLTSIGSADSTYLLSLVQSRS